MPQYVRDAINRWWESTGRHVRRETATARVWMDEHPLIYVPGLRSTGNASVTTEPWGCDDPYDALCEYDKAMAMAQYEGEQ